MIMIIRGACAECGFHVVGICHNSRHVARKWPSLRLWAVNRPINRSMNYKVVSTWTNRAGYSADWSSLNVALRKISRRPITLQICCSFWYQDLVFCRLMHHVKPGLSERCLLSMTFVNCGQTVRDRPMVTMKHYWESISDFQKPPKNLPWMTLKRSFSFQGHESETDPRVNGCS